MANQFNNSDNTDAVVMDEDLMLLMTILDRAPRTSGLKSEEWGDESWAKIADESGMSVT